MQSNTLLRLAFLTKGSSASENIRAKWKVEKDDAALKMDGSRIILKVQNETCSARRSVEIYKRIVDKSVILVQQYLCFVIDTLGQ